jgi:hypothetical protein
VIVVGASLLEAPAVSFDGVLMAFTLSIPSEVTTFTWHCYEQCMALFSLTYMCWKMIFLAHSSTVCEHMQPLCCLRDTYSRYHCHTEKLPVDMVQKSQRISDQVFFLYILHVSFEWKGKVVSTHTMKADSGSRGIAPLFLNLDARWGWVVSITAWPLYPWERTPVPIE